MDAVSVTAARGFRAGGIACGIKASGASDLAAVVADVAASVAGVFTRSRAAAAPVLLSGRRVTSGSARAVLINSGCANAATGAKGMSAAEITTAALADHLGCMPDEVLACSTGPIGTQLPVTLITSGVPALCAALGTEGGGVAATAIMTTDSHPKQAAVEVHGGIIGGMAKGAGMLKPDMATMLAVLTTDLVATPDELDAALRRAVDVTFNCLNVDGCQSTNDTAIILASGLSGVRVTPDQLEAGIEEVCRSLAAQMAADAEGASKVVTLDVNGAASFEDARKLAMAVADSALVRASFFGADPNWGRVLAALGVAGVDIDQERVDIDYSGVAVCRGGVGVAFDEADLIERLHGDFAVRIHLGAASGSARIITTDLTPDYVRFNAERS